MATTKKLNFDDGLIRLEINDNGVLTFAPSDMNLYQRFMAFSRELPALEEKYHTDIEAPEDGGQDAEIALTGKLLDQAKEIDADIKRRLSEVFGPGNDFDKLLGGVNLMSFANNGERVITNFLRAITPYVEAGAKKYAQAEADGAVAAARAARAKRKPR